jgi:hypothetical protein
MGYYILVWEEQITIFVIFVSPAKHFHSVFKRKIMNISINRLILDSNKQKFEILISYLRYHFAYEEQALNYEKIMKKFPVSTN